MSQQLGIAGQLGSTSLAQAPGIEKHCLLYLSARPALDWPLDPLH